MKTIFNKKITTGFTLIEVLITVVIFSIGLLGLASIQINSLRLSHDSLLRVTANVLASDMADRMRSNLAATELGITSPYNNSAGTAVGNPACLAKDSNGNSVDTNCTATEMAQHDFYEWMSTIQGQNATSWHPEIKSELPDGAGIVCIDSTPNDGEPPPGDPACDNIIAVPGKVVYAIKVWWSERKGGSKAGALHRFVMDVSM